ncbi:MAG: hypothetical protein MZV49_23880 [Rhodopseudomonas palustris]|nr:hypothetical protein [Rhodopseudomonas palustris]
MGRRGSSSDASAGDGGALEAAVYVVETTTHLAFMARRHRLDMLGYLLDMARMEAAEIVRLHQGGANSPEQHG